MGRGFGEAVRLQLAGTPGIEPVWVSALRDVPSVGVTRVLEGYFSLGAGGLRVHAVLEDAAPVRSLRAIDVGGPAAGGVLPLARSIAREIEGGARPLPTDNAEAFRSYIAAIEAPDVASADGAFERAVAADPNFGAASVAWVQSLLSRGDRAGAARALVLARDRNARFPELERARLSLLSAALAGDRGAERGAWLELTRADPADAAVYQRLGDLDAAAHSYRSAAAFYQQAAARAPSDIGVLNQLGYVRAWAGDLDGAVQALASYRALRPNEANPLDSLGDAYYYAGRFPEAEKAYLDAYAKDPAFLGGGELHKAAWARLRQADLAGADSRFKQFLQARQTAGDPLVEYRQAQWEYLSGRRGQGFARLERFAQAATGPASSRAYAQLAIWTLEAGDRARARAFAAKAGADPLAVLARLLAEPPVSAAEWSARAANAFPNPAQAGLRRLALAAALLLSKNFADAVGPLEDVYRATQPSSPDWPAVPLAWALIETSRYERVPQLLSGNPPPEPTDENPLLSLGFPRVFFLRALLAQKQGQPDDAKAHFALFRKFTGERAQPAAQ